MGPSRALGQCQQGFPLSWCRGTGASRATGQRGQWGYPTAAPDPTSSLHACHLVCFVRVLAPCHSLFGPPQGKCLFLWLAPSQAGSCHKSQCIPAVMLQFLDPSSQPETPTRVPPIHPLLPTCLTPAGLILLGLGPDWPDPAGAVPLPTWRWAVPPSRMTLMTVFAHTTPRPCRVALTQALPARLALPAGRGRRKRLGTAAATPVTP